MWSDIAMIVFSAVLANHLGLIDAVEKVIRHKIPIVNCSKCLGYWATLAYTLISGMPVVHSIAISFASAYTAIWLELSFGLIDNLYNDIYESSFTSDKGDSETSDSEAAGSEDTKAAMP